MSSPNLCECHCGTRIDLDQQLLEQREMWKQKYLCQQKQFKADIETLKENIYGECSNIMQQEFSLKEAEHNKIVNQKNVEIKDLIARVVNLQSELKVLSKEKELLQQKVNDLDADAEQKDQTINYLKNQSIKTVREWELRNEEQLINLRKKLTSSNKEDVEKLELENEHLKHKIKQFQQKYQRIIPEVEKMKSSLAAKSVENEQLQTKIQKMVKNHEQKIGEMKQEIEDIEKVHGTCPKHIKNLQSQKEELQRELEKAKKISKEVKVEPVYIDRPVEVQKVVEKIIEVERVVKKFIDDPNSPKMVSLQEENNKLKEEINNMLVEIKQIQQQYQKVVNDYEESIKAYEENTIKYKREREALAERITDQTKEIEMLQNFVQRMSGQKVSRQTSEGQKIVVHIKQDGSFQKTVQKLPNQPSKNPRKKN